MKNQFFISYRRKDSAGDARSLARLLREKGGHESVFLDVADLGVSADWKAKIQSAVEQSTVFFLMIGPSWNKLFGRGWFSSGTSDVLRFEVETALSRSPAVPIVPLLLDGAPQPSRLKLPGKLRALARAQMHALRHDSFERDAASMFAQLSANSPTVRSGSHEGDILKVLVLHQQAYIGVLEAKRVEAHSAIEEMKGAFDPAAFEGALVAATNKVVADCLHAIGSMPSRLGALSDAERRVIVVAFAALGDEYSLPEAWKKATDFPLISEKGAEHAAKYWALGMSGAALGAAAGTALPVVGNVVGAIVGFIGGVAAASKESSYDVKKDAQRKIDDCFDGLKRSAASEHGRTALRNAALAIATGVR